MLQAKLDNVTFVDLSIPALTLLQARVGAQGSEANIVNVNFLRHPFPNECFDTLVCIGGYRYVTHEQKKLFWNEQLRVVRDDGNLFFAQFKPRVFTINGTTLADNLCELQLRLEEKFEFVPKIEFGTVRVATGSYTVAHYKKIPRS